MPTKDKELTFEEAKHERREFKCKLKEIPIDAIEIAGRFRQSFEGIDELTESIRDNGVIQPIAVEIKEADQYLLLAGERRLKASLKAGLERIPAKCYPSGLSELERRSIELVENVHRQDMTYQEECALIAKIHELKIEMYGQRVSTAKHAKGWSLMDTANLVGKSKSQVSKDIKLIEASTVAPEILKEKDKKAALKKFESLAGDIKKKLLAQEERKRHRETPDDIHRQELMDSYIVLKKKKDPLKTGCFEGLAKLPDASVDFIELDPPYGIDLANAKKLVESNPTMQKYHEVLADDYRPWLRTLLKECFRVLKQDRFLVCWFAPEPWFEPVFRWICEAGFSCRRLPGVWVKSDGQTQQPKLYLPNSCEFFFYAAKGQAFLNKPGRLSQFVYDAIPTPKKVHPTERPIGLMNDLLYTFVGEGSVVCVPCLGSGNTLLAANNIACKGFGWDLEESFKDDFVIKVNKGKPGEYVTHLMEDVK